MEDIREDRHVVLKSIMVVAGMFVVVCAAWLSALFAFGFNPPHSAGSLTTLVSTIAGGSWFRWKLKRPMCHRERLGFATGVMLVNAVFPVLYLTAALLLIGLPLKLANYDLALGGGGLLLEPAFAVLIVFILCLVFAEAYFFGWLSTRDRRGAVRSSD